jgi:hypothetical protein
MNMSISEWKENPTIVVLPLQKIYVSFLSNSTDSFNWKKSIKNTVDLPLIWNKDTLDFWNLPNDGFHSASTPI